MKTALYVATVARTYRKALDDYRESPETYQEQMPWYQEQISNCTYRQFTTGFFFGPTSHESQIYDHNTYVKGYVYLGMISRVGSDGSGVFEQKNKFSVGDEVEIMKPSGENVRTKVLTLRDEDGNEMESCPHPGQSITIGTECTLEPFDIIRKEGEE